MSSNGIQRTFENVVKQETPRLVVMIGNNTAGEEIFQWGIVGKIPLMSLIGGVSGLIQAMLSGDPIHGCPQRAVVIAWDEKDRGFDIFVHPDAGVAMVGMLETIKATLVDTQRARLAAAQQFILGPDGTPMRG